MKYYLYKITNTVNGKAYIGWTNNIVNRFKRHQRQGHALHNAICKYGWDTFTKQVLVVSNNVQYIKDLEVKAIALYNTFYVDGKGYNLTRGGEGTVGFAPHNKGKKGWKETSDKTKMKQKASHAARGATVKVEYDGVVYNSYREASDSTGIHYNTLRHRIRQKLEVQQYRQRRLHKYE